MNPLRCFVVDDEAAAITTLKSYINSTDGLLYVDGVQDPVEAKKVFADNNNLPDIVFLDLEMKGISGDQLADIISGKVMIIFSTAHADFAVQSYEYGAIDFLLKPFTYERFNQAIEKCKQFKKLSGNRMPDKNDFISINDSRTGSIHVIEKNRIAYVVAFGNYCNLYLDDGNYLMPLKSLVNTYESLNSDHFFQVHRSWVIHITQVKTYNNDSVTLLIGPVINISRKRKNDFKKWLDRHGRSIK